MRPCVMNCLAPERTQSLPSRRAVVRIAPASLPALASVSPQAPMISPCASGTRYRCFCASLPKRYRCATQSPLWAATDNAIDGSTRASSSMQTQYSSADIAGAAVAPRGPGCPSGRAPRAWARGPARMPVPRPTPRRADGSRPRRTRGPCGAGVRDRTKDARSIAKNDTWRVRQAPGYRRSHFGIHACDRSPRRCGGSESLDAAYVGSRRSAP